MLHKFHRRQVSRSRRDFNFSSRLSLLRRSLGRDHLVVLVHAHLKDLFDFKIILRAALAV